MLIPDDLDEDPTGGSGLLSLRHFDLRKVLSHGASLLASEGKEFDVEEEIGKVVRSVYSGTCLETPWAIQIWSLKTGGLW